MLFEHYANPKFWQYYKKLSQDLQKQADKQFKLLEQDPHHPSLHFKKVVSLWSVRVNDSYRSLAIRVEDGFLWFWIGSHDEYIKLLK